ncbi:amidohydrolase [Polyangium mundeleinium]|uniref:Amidohydrolase family protein n=1 Tax=Polyangium mundeleinium TaxID=2995306 RepID=A0ABT5EPN6_9BACT|nr:amidohydrolase [Polyangium mundeleinium]MDC0743788.1 amidohydrolase family protein [Polyangium mundeleinium]
MFRSAFFAATLAPLALGCGASPAPAPQSRPPADFVFLGGAVRTMDPARPEASAIAVRGDRIVAVGTDAEVGSFIGPETRVERLSGRAVIPGLVDGHCHLHGLGAALESLDVRGKKSPEDVARLVAAEAKGRASGEWITGRGWDQNLFTPAAFPTHAPLDAAVPDHPVALTRIDGHALWANAAALRLAGIDEKTTDPPGGRILRDAAGAPTGVFIDNAMDLVTAKIPGEPPEVTERRILRASERALSLGLTGVHEMGIDDATVAVYRKLAAEGRLPIRVVAYLAGGPNLSALSQRKPDIDPQGTSMFVLRGVKLFADGALGSRGATLLAPYADEPKSVGISITDRKTLTESAHIIADAGFQLAVHAIGDRANRDVLDAFAALGEGRARALRFRIEHAQVLAPEDLPRFAALGVLASMQPTHATSDMPWAPARLGPDRLRGAYAWRSLLDSGARLVFGSDFPVEEPSPLLGLWAAVSRQDPSGAPPGGFLPEQRITLDEALAAFTAGPAYASFTEATHGRIAPGYVADLTVFAGALAADRSLLDAKIDRVILGGKVAFGAAIPKPEAP